MPSKTVLDVGNCGPDHNAIRRTLTGWYDVEVLQADAMDDSLKILRERQVDLVLINRKLDIDYSDGVEILKAIKADKTIGDVPVMLVSNFEEHQQQAIALGGTLGFGKLSLTSPDTKQRLDPILAG